MRTQVAWSARLDNPVLSNFGGADVGGVNSQILTGNPSLGANCDANTPPTASTTRATVFGWRFARKILYFDSKKILKKSLGKVPVIRLTGLFCPKVWSISYKLVMEMGWIHCGNSRTQWPANLSTSLHKEFNSYLLWGKDAGALQENIANALFWISTDTLKSDQTEEAPEVI